MMKQITTLFILLAFLTGCSFSSDAEISEETKQYRAGKCLESTDKSFEILLAGMKNLTEGQIEQVQNEYDEKKHEGVQECIEQYDEESVQCVIDAKDIGSLTQCIQQAASK